MKKTLLLTLGLALAATTHAQELPAPSPMASVSQKVGLTDIQIAYSRPSAKGRKVFGDLVPFGQLWRTGANKATAITFSTDVNLNKTPLKAGTYSLFSIPGEKSWTIILNRNTEIWGTDGYDAAQDALRLEVKPTATGRSIETLTIEVENISPNSAHLVIKWENTSVAIPISMEVRKLAEANIAKALETDAGNWRVYRSAASYYLEESYNQAKALEHIEKSISLKPDNWYNHWIKAEILLALKRKPEAIQSAEKSIAMGEEQAKAEGKPFAYGEGLRKEMAAWK